MNWVEICICLLTVEGGAQYFTKPSIKNPSLTEKRVIVPRITIRPSTMPAIMWRFLARGENIIRKEGEGEGVPHLAAWFVSHATRARLGCPERC